MTTEQKLWIWGRTILRAAWPVLIYVFMPGLCMTVGYCITRSDMTAQEFFVYGSNFYTAVGMSLALYVFSRICKKKGTTLNRELVLWPEEIEWKRALGLLGFGAATAFLLSAALTLFPFKGLLSSYTEASGRMYKGNDLLFAVVTTALLGPVLEEVVFRGFLLNRLLEGFSEKVSVYGASALFALAHGNPLWILYAFAMGVYMSKLSMKEDGILYPICVHVGFNLPSTVICVISCFPRVNQMLFGNKILIFLYGAMAASVIWLGRPCWRLKQS